MVLNYIWIFFFITAFVVAVIQTLFYGNLDIWSEIMNSTFSSAKTAFEISLGLTGVLSLWLGLMKIGERGGVIATFSRFRFYLYEYIGQYVGTRQRRNATGTESHERDAGNQSP